MSIFDGFFSADKATIIAKLTLAEADAQEEARTAAYATAWERYNGVWPDPLTPAKDGVKDAIKVNLAKRVVDAATGYLFATAPGWDLSQEGTAPEAESPDEAWLGGCLEATAWGPLLIDLRTNGGVCGTAYVKVLPADAEHATPWVQTLNPADMTIRWDPRNIDKVLAYICQFPGVDDVTHRPILIRQTTQRTDAGTWEIVDAHQFLDTGGDTWVEERRTPWQYPWPPVAHCKNLPAPNQVYGGSDIPPEILALNEQRNLNLSNRQRVDRLQGHPILWASGMGSMSKLDLRPDQVNLLPSPESKIGQTAPEIHPEAAEQLGKEIVEALLEESATPSIALGRPEAGTPPSGVALRIRFVPLEQKVEILQTYYGALIVEVIRRLFELGGRGPAKRVKLTWATIIPIDPLEEREGLEGEQAMGVTSKATIAKQLGRDWTQEQENLQAELVLNPAPTEIQGDTPSNLRAKAETAKPAA